MLPDSIETIGLDQTKQVQFFNRKDKKYWFEIDLLPSILEAIADDYYVLMVHDKTILPYSNIYWDTQQLKCYHTHHNGFYSRYKVRKRMYCASEECFLEIKQKNNKRKTQKQRNITETFDNLTADDVNYIGLNTPMANEEFQPTLGNFFKRFTLINKQFNERCTIDIDLQFHNKESKKEFNRVVIVEIKYDGKLTHSVLAQQLHQHHIRPNGFSKYCIGMALLHPELKQNRWKEKIRQIKKIEQL
ncbi:polyphosphate polymerase domain-containing protein [Prolixibacteraceae bacterium JC049]|nr:polyphosphate polymerase domain-containing protein [Prolixibacteraceae bacterium JC049]